MPTPSSRPDREMMLMDRPIAKKTKKEMISDTGIGMSRDFQERLFEPFERENNSTVSKVMGSGLGMSICKGIVDSMGGSMTVDSQQGRGSVVTVNLAMKYKADDEGTEGIPAEEAADSGRQTAASRSAIFYEAAETGIVKERDKIRILVVEDNELNREIAKELLEDIGYLVETAEDGESAVLMIKRSDRDYYDAVLMDIQMPGIDGYEAARNIRRLCCWLSAVPTPDSASRCRSITPACATSMRSCLRKRARTQALTASRRIPAAAPSPSSSAR